MAKPKNRPDNRLEDEAMPGAAASGAVHRHDDATHPGPESRVVTQRGEPVPQVRDTLHGGPDDEQHRVGLVQEGQRGRARHHPSAVGQHVVGEPAEHGGQLTPRGTEAGHCAPNDVCAVITIGGSCSDCGAGIMRFRLTSICTA